MSLIPFAVPIFRTGDWWNPTADIRLFDQDFGSSLLDDDPLFRAVLPSSGPYWLRSRTTPLISNLERGLTEVRNDDKSFSVSIDVGQFRPEDVKVKVVDNNLIVEGKHEEKQDERDKQSYVSRSFTRRYMLPKDVDPAKLTSSLTAENGVLRIEAPKEPSKKAAERTIPIQHCGKPAVEQGKK